MNFPPTALPFPENTSVSVPPNSQHTDENSYYNQYFNSKFTLYVIRLQCDKYFIHTSLHELQDDVFLECRLLYDFAKQYLPVSILEKRDNIALYDIDKTVKNYMLLYGVHNVRGGSYSDMELSDNIKNILEEEIKTMTYRSRDSHELIQKVVGNLPFYKEDTPIIQSNSQLFHTMRTPSPENSAWYADGVISKEMIAEHRKNNLSEIEKYRALLSFYQAISEFSYNETKTTISRDFLKDLAWLIEKCNPSEEITVSDKEKYRYVIFYFKQITAAFLHIHSHEHSDMGGDDALSEHINARYVPFFKHPDFLFDDYIYHMPRDSNKNQWSDKKCKYPRYIAGEHVLDSISLLGFLQEFEYIFNYVLNRIEERAFDLAQYSDDFLLVREKRNDYFDYLLEDTPVVSYEDTSEY
jgi:hypothetical protein